MEKKSFMFDLPKNKSAAIKVIGVGGGGGNAVNFMFASGIDGVDFVICNTDAQALNNSAVPNKIQLGISITEGLGAGANPEIGEQAALESIEEVKSLLENNTKMVFITAGMGGGTGTGAAPVIASIAKDLGILTVGIVTSPFYFEGKMRLEQAQSGIQKLRQNVDSLIVVNNDKLREQYGNLGYKAGFAKADEVLSTAAKGIAEVITKNYSVNIDLRDAKTVLSNSGTAIMGSSFSNGENRALEAISNALDSPLLNDNKITGSKNVLLLIVSGESEITVDEIGVINDYIQKEAGNRANIIMGIGEDIELGENINVIVIATGFPIEDQKYTGKEDEKIVHRLEEDQAITKTFSVSKENIPEDDTAPTFSDEKKVIYSLEDEDLEDDAKDSQASLFAQEEDIKLELREEISVSQSIFNEREPQREVEEVMSSSTLVEEAEESQPIFFQLEVPKDEMENVQTEEEEKINFTQKAEYLSEEKVEGEATELEGLRIINAKIEERRRHLKRFNFKFQSEKKLEEHERVPAYCRQGIDIEDKQWDETPSDLKVTEDSNGDVKIRPNNFLHDNVD